MQYCEVTKGDNFYEFNKKWLIAKEITAVKFKGKNDVAEFSSKNRGEWYRFLKMSLMTLNSPKMMTLMKKFKGWLIAKKGGH